MIFRALYDESEWKWIQERAHTILCGDMCGIVARNTSGEIQAVAVFDSFTVNACNVHLAIENPMVIKHGFINEIARYAFVVRDRTRLFGLVPSNNRAAIKFDTHIGMKEITRVPNALAEGVDYIIMQMTKEDCRWLPQPEQVKEVA